MAEEDHGKLQEVWLLCGTVLLVQMDSSESGERFLNYEREGE